MEHNIPGRICEEFVRGERLVSFTARFNYLQSSLNVTV